MIKKSRTRWVFLNYPIVTSRSIDNSGGVDHLLGNLQVYKQLGFKVLCVCRWSPRFIDRLEGGWVLNIVPGSVLPASLTQSSNMDRDAPCLPLIRRVALGLRFFLLTLFGYILQFVLRPQILHERANRRLSIKPYFKNTLHLIELNDEFVPFNRCDAYLTVQYRAGLNMPQFVWCWPVPEVSRFNDKKFIECLSNISKSTRKLNILLFGVGGATQPEIIRNFIANHSWFQNSTFDLHIYGGNAQNEVVEGVIQHGWCDANQLPADAYDAAVLFYDEMVYDDSRLALGSPTKLWKYIDWSLPIFSNRPYISRKFLGLFDVGDAVLHDHEHASNFAQHLKALRGQTKPETYAQELESFFKNLDGGGH